MTQASTSVTENEQAPPRLRMRQITKNFGGVHALSGVSFEAHAGEVHALCGENGAGKSTLMKILAGAITDYGGELELDGRVVRFDGPRDAEAAGVRIIHQELNLVPELSVAANVFLGRERTRFGMIDDAAMEADARALFNRLGAAIDPRSRVSELRIGDQQMVEIAKALSGRADVVIMDEPTSALSDAEVARLFRAIGDLKKRGVAVIYISHKMNEVFTLADRVTVVRDGKFIATAPGSETDAGQVCRWMVGRELGALAYQGQHELGAEVLKVEGLALAKPGGIGRPALSDLSFGVRAGEVVGIAGLLGAGRTELLEALFGASPEAPTGSITLEGKPVRFEHPRQAIRAGVALVTEDRKTLGLFDRMNVGENVTIRHLDALSHAGLVDRRAESKAVAGSIKQLSIKAAGASAAVTSLSGGNQQKCILARWLLTNPRLLLLDEPTRGIDVGAKSEIYGLIRQLADGGMAILMTSSELPELLAVCDRILVLCEGRITADIPRPEATEETIMHAATKFLERATVS
ncbi:sugar ABC transporter ATP-binding protein [Isosphaeraceae bacterium EP7]